jgi:hypothetical protein
LVNDVDSQIRVLESLHDYAGWFGETAPGGVRVSRTCALEMVIDLAIDENQVERMLARLRRLGLAISADAGAIILTDVPRLLDFARFIEARRRDQPRESGVARVGSSASTEPSPLSPGAQEAS